MSTYPVLVVRRVADGGPEHHEPVAQHGFFVDIHRFVGTFFVNLIENASSETEHIRGALTVRSPFGGIENTS
jgi:hypothetical protein